MGIASFLSQIVISEIWSNNSKLFIPVIKQYIFFNLMEEYTSIIIGFIMLKKTL
jgi:hypothetical protein